MQQRSHRYSHGCGTKAGFDTVTAAASKGITVAAIMETSFTKATLSFVNRDSSNEKASAQNSLLIIMRYHYNKGDQIPRSY